MSYQYHIKPVSVKGFEMFVVILVQGKTLVGSTTRWSESDCITWAHRYHKEITNRKVA